MPSSEPQIPPRTPFLHPIHDVFAHHGIIALSSRWNAWRYQDVHTERPFWLHSMIWWTAATGVTRWELHPEWFEPLPTKTWKEQQAERKAKEARERKMLEPYRQAGIKERGAVIEVTDPSEPRLGDDYYFSDRTRQSLAKDRSASL